MDLSREERMQQRLRGAQRRQVKDVDFGLEFPAIAGVAQPGVGQPSTQSESTPQTLSRKTPANLIPPPPITLFEETPKVSLSQGINDANTSAKRRKLDSDLPAILSGRSTRSSQVTPRADIYAIDDDDEQPSHAIGESASASIERASEIIEQDATSPNLPPETPDASIISMPNTDGHFPRSKNAPDSSGGKRASFIDNSGAEQKERQDDNLIEPAEVGVLTTAGPNVTPRPRSAAGLSVSRRQRSKATRESDNDLDELSPEQPMRKRKSNEAGFDDVDELSPEQPTRRSRPHTQPQSLRLNPEKRQPSADPSEDEAEAIGDEEAATRLIRNRGGRRSMNPPNAASSLQQEEGEHSHLSGKRSERRKEQSTVAQQRHPKKSNAKNPGGSKQASSKSTTRMASPIPITVHRLTKAPTYDQDDSDADILNSRIPHVKRGGVNPVDVLSQICYEIVGAAIETLDAGADNCEDSALRREYRTKSRAVEFFGDEIQMRLLDHATNVDNAYSLQRRLRDEQKRKIGLREEILKIRAEREKVALRMDEIRIRHEQETTHARARDSLNVTMHDIELAIDLGNAKISDEAAKASRTLPSIEMQLKRVADEASNTGDSGGMLKQMKEFNAFLERTALILESQRT